MARSTIGWVLCMLVPSLLLLRFGFENNGKVSAPQSRRLENHKGISNSTVPCVTVLAFARPTSLKRLLERLNEIDYGSDSGHVKLTISIDLPLLGVNSKREESVSIASAFEFQHGYKIVDAARSHRGIVRQWVDSSWAPDLDPDDNRPACVIFEDDLVPSKFVWRWIRGALSAYSQDAGEAPSLWSRVASFGLQRPTLVPAQPPQGGVPPRPHGRPFLYKLMASWGLVALRQQWIAFRAFMRVRYQPGHYKDILFHGKALMPSNWHRGAPKGIWTYWFLLFMDERNLFTLYAHLNTKATLCTNMREPGLHYGATLGADFPTLESEVSALHTFPPLQDLAWIDWNAAAVSVNNLVMKPNCHVAVATLATEFTPELRTFLRSMLHFNPDVPIYIAGNRNVSRDVAAAFPESRFAFDTDLAHYGNRVSRNEASEGKWLRFEMEKARVLRNALNDGCRGAWFFDQDQRLFSSLPPMHDVQVALTPDRLSTSAAGLFNAGCLYVSGYEPLDLWEVTALTQTPQGCCRAQVALDKVSREMKWTDPGEGVNVGVLEMTASLSIDGRNHFPELKCQEGEIVYRGSKLVNLHFSPNDSFGRPLVPFLNKAVKDCGYPPWLSEG